MYKKLTFFKPSKGEEETCTLFFSTDKAIYVLFDWNKEEVFKYSIDRLRSFAENKDIYSYTHLCYDKDNE